MQDIRDPRSTVDLVARLLAAERSRARWRTLAIAAAAGIAGAMVGGAGQSSSQRPLQAVVLDSSRSSGRWSATLLGVDDTGKVRYLNTTKPQPSWEPFQYSP